ncbi:MAG TPA: ABC transporter substrate-binding protein [Jatrophihabitantaceae bacterium]
MTKARLSLALVACAVTIVTLSACGTRLPQSDITSAAAARVIGSGDTALGGGTGANGQPDAAIAAQSTLGSTPSGGALVPGAPGATAAGTGQTGGGGGGGGSAQQGGGGSASGPATGSTVVLGNIGTFNGFVGQSVVGYQQMLGVWEKWVNAHGGLNGHPVHVISENDNGDPSTALTIAKQMVEQDHILAFFDPFLLFDFAPITAYAASVNLPIVGGDGLNPAWGSTPIAFPATAPLAAIANAGNRFAANGGQKKVGVLYCVETPDICGEYNTSIKAQAGRSGVTIAYDGGMSMTSASYTSQCINAQQAGVQMLWVVADGPSVSRVAASCNAQGFHPRYAVVSLATTPTLPSVPGLNNAIIPAGTFPSQVANSQATKDYHTAVSEYAPSLASGLDGPTSNVWASGALMVAASKYLSSKPTTAQLFQGLYAIANNNLGGLTVSLTFHKGGSPTLGSCAFMSGIANGAYTAPIGSSLVC